MNAAAQIKTEFETAIDQSVAYMKDEWAGEVWAFSRRPRRASASDIVRITCLMGGGNLKQELSAFPGLQLAVSSYVEAKGKIPPPVYYDLLRRFNAIHEAVTPPMLWHGKRLIGIDGCCVNTCYNPSAPSFMPSSTCAKGGYNQYKANLMVDLLSNEPIDVSLQPISHQNEHAAALGMLAFNPLSVPSVLVCDRAYSTYPMLAEMQNMENCDFIIRTKGGPGAMKPIRALGREREEFDEDIEFVLTDNQKQESKRQGHIYIPTGSAKGNSPKTYISRFAQPLPYLMKLRVVRCKLPGTENYETLLTSLKRENGFTAEDIVVGYGKRWKQELFHKFWKYSAGIAHTHCRREDFSQIEIYASLAVSSVIWKIINAVPVQQKDTRKYEYALNATQATFLIREFLKTPGADADQLMADLARYVVPVRPGRADVRRLQPHSFVPFEYRIP